MKKQVENSQAWGDLSAKRTTAESSRDAKREDISEIVEVVLESTTQILEKAITWGMNVLGELEHQRFREEQQETADHRDGVGLGVYRLTKRETAGRPSLAFPLVPFFWILGGPEVNLNVDLSTSCISLIKCATKLRRRAELVGWAASLICEDTRRGMPCQSEDCQEVERRWRDVVTIQTQLDEGLKKHNIQRLRFLSRLLSWRVETMADDFIGRQARDQFYEEVVYRCRMLRELIW